MMFWNLVYFDKLHDLQWILTVSCGVSTFQRAENFALNFLKFDKMHIIAFSRRSVWHIPVMESC